jgi:hypothetical protein
MTDKVFRLPVPEHLEPKHIKRSLLQKVRDYFVLLYNARTDFREFLVATGNDDAITLNRVFDRHNAVLMIRAAATKANDTTMEQAEDGIIYKHLNTVMKDYPELRPKQRRLEYKRQQRQHQQEAAE